MLPSTCRGFGLLFSAVAVLSLIGIASWQRGLPTVGESSFPVAPPAPSTKFAAQELVLPAQKRRLGAPTACQAIQVELSPCDGGSCAAFLPPPSACVWEQWSEWNTCSCHGSRKRHREIQSPGGLGGAPCEGTAQEAQPCRASECMGNVAMDCKLAQWSPWSDCTKSCEGGQQYHTRDIIRQQSGFGVFCSDSMHETRACKTIPCPGKGAIDCQWSQWNMWSACTTTCGNGQKRRSRSIKVSPKNGGKLCQPLTSEEVAKCGQPCGGLAVDCLWSLWTKWSPCSKSCGEGQTFRTRRVAREARMGGNGCRGFFEDYRTCSVKSCSGQGVDCAFGTWSPWSGCSAPCNGHHSRNRMIANVALVGGQPCRGPTQNIEPCNLDAAACRKKKVDCKYAMWDFWSTCSRSCGGGMSQRKRGIAIHAQGPGKQCSGDLESVKRCNTYACVGGLAVDCKWSSWSRWSACTLSCGGGQQRRHRTVVLESASGGKPCNAGDSIQVGSCSIQPCLAQKFMCDWASWGDWSMCARAGMSVTCGGGQRKRSRTTRLVKRFVRFDLAKQSQELDGRRLQGPGGASPSDAYGMKTTRGKADTGSVVECKEVQDVLEPCAMATCAKLEPVDCAWALWSEWSSCPCEGIRERHRVIESYAVASGAPCEGSEVQNKPCKGHCNQTASLDCVYSTWSAWAACPVSCGGSFSERFRSVVQYPRGRGKTCLVGLGGKRAREKCNSFPCPVTLDCHWGDWSTYSACSNTCGGGQMSRARNVRQVATNGGQPCAQKDSMIVALCNPQACPSNARDCEFSTWGDWLSCSQTCGIGSQRRTRVVMVDATQGGKACTGRLQAFQECNMGRCRPEPVMNCMWAVWDPWSACTALCNGHKERSRAIKQFAQNGGRTCEGSERDIRGCNVNSPICKSDNPHDCVLSTWAVWTSCSKRCEGGQHYRTREVQVPAKNFGKTCAGPLQQVQACNIDPCPGTNRVDCQWHNWGQWSACTMTCNGGQKMRERGIAVEAKNGGGPCGAQASIELAPCNAQSCMNAMEVCGWAEWIGWEDCSQSCGGGQQQRIRLRQWLPSALARARSNAQPMIGPRGRVTPQRRLMERRLIEPPLVGGPDDCTGSQKEIRPCGIGPCDLGGPMPSACKWAAWESWGSCTCEGFQERGRHVAQRAQNGGLVCVGPLRVSKACLPNCESKSVSCSFGTWAEWSECSASCDGGQKFHSRSLKTHALRYGDACRGRLEEVQACNSMPCSAPKDCRYGDWAQWSTCSRSCDGGQKSRSRDVAQYSTPGGKPCGNGALMEVTGCGDTSCTPWSPSDCQWSTWSVWGQCSATCGHGRQFRARTIVTLATHSGRPCRGLYQDYRDCKLLRCEKAPANCNFLTWSPWTDCFDTCSGHKERTRQVGSFAAGLGGKPCQGPLRQVTPCAAVGVDSSTCSSEDGSASCVIGDWSLWSACTKTCGSGQHYRHRGVLQQARGSGQPCDTSLKMTGSCSTDACPGSDVVDCTWADWDAFSACTATCGGGEMRRHRSIKVEAKNGGQICSTGATLELRPCSMVPCDGQGSCSWAMWSSWQECSSTCGPGEKRRRRDLVPQARPALPSPSVLAIALDGEVAPDDMFTSFAMRHQTAVGSLAILGCISGLLVLGQLLAPMAQRVVQRNRGPAYAALGTEDIGGGHTSEEERASATDLDESRPFLEIE